MKAFVTGSTGFIGSRLVDQLKARGYDVTALVRSEKDAANLRAKGVTPVIGDIREKETMRAGMQGADVVFHTAAWYKYGEQHAGLAEAVNVGGTYQVLSLARELGVPRIVYTSTLAVNGDTQGRVVDETYHPSGESFLTEYDRTKYEAEFEEVRPMIEQGLPVVIVRPGVVYGPGDHSTFGQVMEGFYKGLFPIFPMPDFEATYAYVDDVVNGHILAAEKGEPGQTYILAGPVYSMRELTNMWSNLTGRPAPLLNLPPRLVKSFAPVMGWLRSVLPLPELLDPELTNIVDASYLARSDKARQQLGWQTRPVRDGMRETFRWMEGHVPAPTPEGVRRDWTMGTIFSLAAVLLTIGLIFRPWKRRG